MVHTNFKKSFEKTSGIASELALLSPLALAPIVKRYGFKSFDYAKRKAMGLGPKGGTKNFFHETVFNDIKKVEDMKPGFRKTLNKYVMEESPLMALWMGPSQGKMVGEKMRAPTKVMPKVVKELISDLTSTDDKLVKETADKLKALAIHSSAAALGAGLGLAAVRKIKNSKDENQDFEMQKAAGRVGDAFRVLFGKSVGEKKKFFIPIGLNERTEQTLKKMTSPLPLIGAGLATGAGMKIADKIIENSTETKPTRVIIMGSESAGNRYNMDGYERS